MVAENSCTLMLCAKMLGIVYIHVWLAKTKVYKKQSKVLSDMTTFENSGRHNYIHETVFQFRSDEGPVAKTNGTFAGGLSPWVHRRVPCGEVDVNFAETLEQDPTPLAELEITDTELDRTKLRRYKKNGLMAGALAVTLLLV